MVSAFTAGIVFGLSAGLAPGPLLTLVVSQTLRHNTKEGVKVALAPLITDLPIILMSLLVLSRLSDFGHVLGLISLLGGLYVLYLAYESFRTGPVHLKVSEECPQSLRKGSLVNALNPHPYLFWVTVGAPFILKAWENTPVAPLIFISCFYLLLVGSKIFLALIVGKSRSFLTSKRYLYVMRLLAAILALFALVLFKDGLAFLGVFG
jgi:threonine/homoserine/homoserine lactone efflux protein